MYVCVCMCVCVSVPAYRRKSGVDGWLQFRFTPEHLDGVNSVPHPVTWLLLSQSRRRKRSDVFFCEVRVNVPQFLR